MYDADHHVTEQREGLVDDGPCGWDVGQGNDEGKWRNTDAAHDEQQY